MGRKRAASGQAFEGDADAAGGFNSARRDLELAAASLDAGAAVEVLRDSGRHHTLMSIVRRDRRLVSDRVRAATDLLVGEAPRWDDTGVLA